MKKNRVLLKYDSPRIIKFNFYQDERGEFKRVYCINELKKLRKKIEVKQINYTKIKHKGTIKGIHFQKHPYSEIKIVNVIKGKIYDVLVDVRKKSKNFLKKKKYILSSSDNNSLIIPKGFGHSFQTLTDNCEIIYCHSEIYKPIQESSINPFDPILNIKWPLKVSKISLKDKNTKYISSDFKGILI